MKISVNQSLLESICNKQNISYLGLFGSQVRGDSHIDSDVDVLVDFTQTKSYFELARAQEALEAIFNKRVDLVLRNKIKSSIKPYILNNLTTLYEKR